MVSIQINHDLEQGEGGQGNGVKDLCAITGHG